MGFSRKRRNFIKFFMVTFIIVLFISGSLYCGYYFYNYHINQIISSYEDEIDNLKMDKYSNKRIVYLPINNIEHGSILHEDLLEKVEIYSSISQEFFISEEDIGKIAKINLSLGIPIMKNMIIEEKIPDDIREEEFNMLLLSTNLRKGTFIDLRINFPNGEDYVVLSKKKIRDLDKENNTLWLWLNEEEILRVSSAIVDAYMHKGTKLYTVVYVEPTLQKEAEVSYPVNVDVLKVMKTNPNIIQEAKNELNEEMRTLLDERLEKIDEEALSSVESSLNKEQNTRQQIIQEESTDKELDNENTEEIDEDDGITDSNNINFQ